MAEILPAAPSPRTVPVNVTMAPMSVRPAVRRRTSAPMSKSSFCTRTDIAQPPVTGGKKAISRAPARLAEGLTWARANASAYSGPRPLSQATSSATVPTPAGKSTISSALPVFSRTQAKYRILTDMAKLMLHGGADRSLQIVVAGPQRQQRGHPQHGEPGRAHDRHDDIAGGPGQQDAEGDHLQGRLPFGELGHVHLDVE